MPERRTIVDRLPWLDRSLDEGRSYQWWVLDIEGPAVYVTDRRDGWRVAEGGGIINFDLNGGEPFESREAAMQAGARVARVRAVRAAEQAHEQAGETLKTLRELVIPIGA